MTVFELVMLYFSSAVSALYLAAGGWVKIKAWYKSKVATEAAEFEAKVRAVVTSGTDSTS